MDCPGSHFGRPSIIWDCPDNWFRGRSTTYLELSGNLSSRGIYYLKAGSYLCRAKVGSANAPRYYANNFSSVPQQFARYYIVPQYEQSQLNGECLSEYNAMVFLEQLIAWGVSEINCAGNSVRITILFNRRSLFRQFHLFDSTRNQLFRQFNFIPGT